MLFRPWKLSLGHRKRQLRVGKALVTAIPVTRDSQVASNGPALNAQVLLVVASIGPALNAHEVRY